MRASEKCGHERVKRFKNLETRKLTSELVSEREQEWTSELASENIQIAEPYKTSGRKEVRRIKKEAGKGMSPALAKAKGVNGSTACRLCLRPC